MFRVRALACVPRVRTTGWSQAHVRLAEQVARTRCVIGIRARARAVAWHPSGSARARRTCETAAIAAAAGESIDLMTMLYTHALNSANMYTCVHVYVYIRLQSVRILYAYSRASRSLAECKCNINCIKYRPNPIRVSTLTIARTPPPPRETTTDQRQNIPTHVWRRRDSSRSGGQVEY